MGRRRSKTPAWLPKRVYPHGRQYLYRPKQGKPIPLGPIDDPGACLRRYGDLVGQTARPVTIGEVIDKYLTEYVPQLAPRTQVDYRAYCAKLKHALGHMLPDEVEITDLYDYHTARKAPVRANREITVLGLVYRHAIRWRAATRNPVSGFLYEKERARERLVSARERRLFARHYTPAWLRGYILLKYLTGRRQGEMLRLSTFNEKPDGIIFQILKKRRLRTITVTWTPRLQRVWTWLKALPRPDNCSMLFWSSKGKNRGQGISASGFKSAWQRAQAKWVADGNEAFWEHDLRGAAGSAAESDMRAQELLDHESVTTTRRSYRRATAKKVRALK